MHLHIIGICGTFMGSLALLARELGYRASGCDANTYPPMSTQLEECGIEVLDGYLAGHLDARPDLVLVGNTISRGNPVLERALEEGTPCMSGPQWLAQYVLRGKWALGVAGTHGKTSTSAMLAWILEYAGLRPGFLIGGVTNNFPVSARLGETPFFVVEADEYDSAFSDKRSKFVHYAPRTTILNNLEFDHADIFEDLAAIQRQFHHLLRVLPGNGRIVMPADEPALEEVLARGCWTPVQRIGMELPTEECKRLAGDNGLFWNIRLLAGDGSEFKLEKHQADAGKPAVASVTWDQTGLHNVRNAAAAIVAAEHAGVRAATAAEALGHFRGVKRRLELRGAAGGVSVYDDFAHHPTAIATTLQGLAAKLDGEGRIIAVIEPALQYDESRRASAHAGRIRKAGRSDRLVPAARLRPRLRRALRRNRIAVAGIRQYRSHRLPPSRYRRTRRPRCHHEQRRLRRHPRKTVARIEVDLTGGLPSTAF